MLSVVTITFNNYEDLLKTLESLNSVENCELVVINGGTCVRTLNYLKTAKNVKLAISEPDKGIADAYNKGILNSTGDYITFLNSGDRYVGSDYYQKAELLLNRNSEIDFVHGDIFLEDKFVGKIHVRPSGRDFALEQPFLFPSMVFRKSVFQKIGNFDLRYRIAMDFDLIVRMDSKFFKGTHLQEGPVVLMDGVGLSNTREIEGVRESFLSLKRNGKLNIKRLFFFNLRFIRVLTKSFLLQFGLDNLIIFFKKKKYHE